MTVEVQEGMRVHARRTLAASPERVFRAFTDPEELAAWSWGSLGRDCTARVDLRVGGRYDVFTSPPAGDTSGWEGERWSFAGVYVEIESPRRLVYTLHWNAPVGYNQQGGVVVDEAVTVELEPAEEGTLLEMTHVGIPDDGLSAGGHAEGIADMLAALAKLVEA